MNKQPVIEFYYSFNDMDPGKAKELLKETEFQNEAEAIRTAKSGKLILYKHRFVNGKKTLTEKLFDPFSM